MLNGSEIDSDKSNGSIAAHIPSDAKFHFICHHREERTDITSVDNIMHRLTNTMSRCTDDVVGIDNNDNNNISTMESNRNGTRYTELSSSSEYGEEITMSIDIEHTLVSATVGDGTLCWYIDYIHPSCCIERKAIMHSRNIAITGSLMYSIGIDNIGKSVTITLDINSDTSQDGEHPTPKHNTGFDLTLVNITTIHNISSLESDNLYQHCGEENDKDNTHEYGIDRSMYECKDIEIATVVGNILKCNDSPKKSDGRGSVN